MNRQYFDKKNGRRLCSWRSSPPLPCRRGQKWRRLAICRFHRGLAAIYARGAYKRALCQALLVARDLAQLFAGASDYEAYSDAPVLTGTFANTTAGRSAEAFARANLVSQAANVDTELATVYP